MKPTTLKPGDRVTMEGTRHPLIFNKRIPRQGSRSAMNLFHCKEYIGLNGPDDEGAVEVSDADVVRRCMLDN